MYYAFAAFDQTLYVTLYSCVTRVREARVHGGESSMYERQRVVRVRDKRAQGRAGMCIMDGTIMVATMTLADGPT